MLPYCRTAALCGLLFTISLNTLSYANTTTGTKALSQLTSEPTIRVLLLDNLSSVTLTPQTRWTASTFSGSSRAELTPDTRIQVIATDGKLSIGDWLQDEAEGIVFNGETSDSLIMVHTVPVGVGWWWESAEDRTYEGRLEIRPSGKGLAAILELPLERYLRGVVPSEIGTDSPQAAYGAQAVAARSAAVLAVTSSIYSGPNFDICSDVACQVFSGVHKSNPVADAAIEETRGMILSFEGRPLSAYYASNCGGHTEDIRNVWPDRSSDRGYHGTARFDGDSSMQVELGTDEAVRKWLESSPPAWCNPAHAKIPAWATKNFRWEREVSADELTSRVAERKDVGRIREIRSMKRGHSGRLIEAEFVGEKGSVTVGPELAIRQVWQPPLRSATFVVDTIGSDDRPTTFTVRGAGWGHGVGMCQSGAIGMAHAAKSVKEILNHYFSNATVEKLY